MSTITRVYYELIARDNASRTFRKVGDESAFAEGRIARLGKAFALVGGAAAVAGAAIAVESIRMATSFQAAMTKVQTQAGASAGDVKVLSDQILRLASSHAQQAPIDLANAMYHLKSVGLDNVKAMQALRQASDLAAVGGANLEETTTALAGAWRSGIKGAQNFGQAAGTVNAIIGAGNMRMQDFIDAIGTGILPAARTWGVSLASIGSALALMTDEGVPANEAATRLRMTLSLMGAPSHKATVALASIGLSETALAKAMRSPGGLVSAVQLLKKHLDDSGLSAVQSAQVISHAFGGGRSSSAIMTLLNNVTVLGKKQDQINRDIGKFGPAVVAQSHTAAAAFSRLRTEMDVIGIRIGAALLPPVTRFAKFLADTVIPGVINLAGVVKRHLGPVLDPIDQLMDALFGGGGSRGHRRPAPFPAGPGGRLSPAFRFGGPAPPSGQFRGGAPGGLRGSFYGILGTALPTSTKPLSARLGTMLGEALSNAMVWLGAHASKWTGTLVKVLANIDWVNVGKAVGGNAIGFALGFIGSLGNDLFSLQFWQKHWLDVIMGVLSLLLVGRFGGLIAKILEKIPILRAFAPLFRGLEKLSKPVFEGGWALVKSIGRGIADGIKRVLPEEAAALRRWVLTLIYNVARLYGAMVNAAIRLTRGLGDGILSMGRAVGRVIGTAIGWLIKPFARAGSWLISAGKSVVQGLLGGIRSFMSGIGTWVNNNIVKPLVGAVLHFFGIKSPSTVMAGIGGNLIKGLLKGLASHSPLQIARHIFGGLPQALGHFVDKGLVKIAQLPGRALKALGALGGNLLALLGLGGGGGGGSMSANQKLGQVLAAAMGWTGSQFDALRALWMGESGWNQLARNPSSGAYGIPQALPADKMASAGSDWLTNAATQIRWGLGYIKAVYGSPLNAYSQWLSRSPHWYGSGLNAIFNRPTVIGVGERGPEKVTVTPLGRGRHGSGPVVWIENFNPVERADLDLLASKIVFGLGV